MRADRTGDCLTTVFIIEMGLAMLGQVGGVQCGERTLVTRVRHGWVVRLGVHASLMKHQVIPAQHQRQLFDILSTHVSITH
jgi:hypothetical protein